MDRFAKFLCDPVKVIKTLIAAAVGIGLVVYVWLLATGDFDSDIVTAKSVSVAVNETIECNAYIFRDETVIGKNNTGTIVTVVSEGDRVSKGQLLANIYPNEADSVLQDEINRIDRKIEILDKSSVDSQYVITDLSKIDGDISGIFADIYADSAHGNVSDAIDGSAKLLVELNKRDVIVNSDIDYTLERQQLVDERNRIEAQISSNSSAVYASSSGYFYGDVDGYEEIFSPDVIDTLTLKSFEEISNKEPDEGILSSGAVKVINDFVWYLVCEAPSDRAASLVTGRSYDIVFPESGDETISMRLVNVVSETTASEALAIFRANVMPASFDYKRGQRAEIVMDVVEGLSVPKKALRSVDGENGVYVRVGDVIHYRSVEIVDEVDNYYIVSFGKKAQYFEEDGEEGDDNINKKEPSKPLGLYDNIVVSGKDLFDGKIVG